MTPILNGNLSICAIRLKLKKDPFPSKLYSHIPSKMDPSRPLGVEPYAGVDQGFWNLGVGFLLTARY